MDGSGGLSKEDEEVLNELKEDVKEYLGKNVKEVVIDSGVFLQLVQRCGAANHTMSGVLLGINKGEKLEVTNGFQLPRKSKSQEGKKIKVVKFQTKYLKALKPFQVDNYIIGWFQTSRYDSFLTLEAIQQQFVHQKIMPERCVMLVIDTTKSQKGMLDIRGYRFTKKFMQFVKDTVKEEKVDATSLSSIIRKIESEIYNEGYPMSVERSNFTHKDVVAHKLSYKDIYEELKVSVVSNSCLVDNFLRNVLPKKMKIDQFTQLDLSCQKHIEDSVQNLIMSTKDFHMEHVQQSRKYRRADGVLDLLLLSHQVGKNCQEISQFASNSLNRLFLAKDLMAFKEDEK